MSEYRNEFSAVNERVAALQAELARLGPREGDTPPRVSPLRLAVVLGVTLLAAALTWVCSAGAIDTLARARPVEVVQSPRPPADPPRTRTGLAWLTDEARVGTQGQRFLDVDSDQKPELIGLAWDRAVEERGQGLHVVALDAKTLRPKWTSAAYFGHRARGPEVVEHLVVMPAGVILSDARGFVHVLDPATGVLRKDVALGFPVDAACPAPDGSPRALVAREGIPWRESPGPLIGLMSHEIARLQNVLIDATTGKATPASIHTFCDWSEYCGRHEEGPCRALSEDVDAPPKLDLEVAGYSVFRDGDARFGVGTVNLTATGDDAVPQRYVAAQWSATTRQIAWKTALSMRGGLNLVDVTVGAGVFVTLDQGPAGPGHLRALDARTGAVRFERELDHAGIGTQVNAMFAHDESIYIAREGRLDRYDASTGALGARSDAP